MASSTVPTSSSSPKQPSTAQLYSLLAPIVLDLSDSRSKFHNWAKTFSCQPLTVFEPTSEEQCGLIVELARREGTTVRCAGAGHSPSDLACTQGYMVRMDKLEAVIEIDKEKYIVETQAGISLHSLHRLLATHDLAMSNVGSISDQSLGGIITTATHGSGTSFPVISSGVISLWLLKADGSIAECSRENNKELFLATLCGLGTTGLILRVRLQVEKAFRLRETVEPLTFDQFVDEEAFKDIGSSSEHTRAWWFPQVDSVSVARANRTYDAPDAPPTWRDHLWNVGVGFHLVQFLLFISRYIPSFTPPVCRFVWNNFNGKRRTHTDDSYKVFNFDCLFAQYTTEWAIPAEQAPACLREMHTWLAGEAADPNGIRVHFPIEIRWTSDDDIWLSPSYGRQTVYIGIVQYRPYGLSTPYRRYFSRFVNIIASHSGRPHWAKAHDLQPSDLRALYPKFEQTVELIHRVDPDGLFRNEYVRRHLLGEEGEQVDAGCFRSSGRRGV